MIRGHSFLHNFPCVSLLDWNHTLLEFANVHRCARQWTQGRGAGQLLIPAFATSKVTSSGCHLLGCFQGGRAADRAPFEYQRVLHVCRGVGVDPHSRRAIRSWSSPIPNSAACQRHGLSPSLCSRPCGNAVRSRSDIFLDNLLTDLSLGKDLLKMTWGASF